MIEFIDVIKKYDNRITALNKVNFFVEKGEFVFIVGPSGSGKSTILKLMLKEQDLTDGEITVNGHKISTLKRKNIPFLRRGLGIVFQDFRLLPNRTVFENVAFAMKVTEAMPKEIRRQVPLTLALVGLSKKADQFPNELSGGEQQRVAIARAIVNNPFLIIADEPTGNLDPESSWDIMKLFKEINIRGTTVLVATHEKSIVDNMKQRVIAIDGGEIVRDQEKGQY